MKVYERWQMQMFAEQDVLCSSITDDTIGFDFDYLNGDKVDFDFGQIGG